MKDIGGFFELELNPNSEYHKNAIKLNSGRSALEYILLANSYEKIYVPNYTCLVVIEIIKKLNIKYECYDIDINFKPIFDIKVLKNNEVLLVNNYFGLLDKYIDELCDLTDKVIIDNTQAFYHRSKKNINSFYSPRKFFGVSDGGYAYSKNKLPNTLDQDKSYTRFSHLIKRIDLDAQSSYPDYIQVEEEINSLPMLEMSQLTKCILTSINYKKIAKKRTDNFNYLHQHFQTKNLLKLETNLNNIPLTYPLLLNKDIKLIKDKLKNNNIYIPTYWPGVCSIKNIEYFNNILFLPIDQRLKTQDLNKIISFLVKELVL